MNDLFRTFIAIKIYPESRLLNLYEELQTTLPDEAIKWVEPENLHLTLRFLGDTATKQIEDVKEILSKTSQHFHLFQFRLKGLGYFRKNGQPNVLFAKVEEGEPLQRLFLYLDKLLTEVGFEGETREFRPHLTLARIK